MKQLFVCDSLNSEAGQSFPTGMTEAKALGALSMVNEKNGYIVDDSFVDSGGDFISIYLGRGDDLQPRHIPGIDTKTLKVTKSAFNSSTMGGAIFEAVVTPTITNVVEGDIYTLILSKVGTPFNERGNWTFDYVVPSDSVTVDEIINYFVDAINNNNGLPLTAENDSSTLAITGNDNSDWTITGADDWQGTIVISTNGAEPVQDTAWLKKLARECAENKGFEYIAEDGKELYPGYLQDIPAGKTFTIYTLRWATPRVSAKTRDEVVSQLLYIAIDSTKTVVIGNIDNLFKLN